MKVIDLLNKIANGEEVPKKIKYKNSIYCYREQNGNIIYQLEDYHAVLTLQCFEDLNNEIEIIEEDKKIRKIYTFPGLDDDDYAYEDGNRPNNVKINDKMEGLLIDKINEIIDYLEEK